MIARNNCVPLCGAAACCCVACDCHALPLPLSLHLCRYRSLSLHFPHSSPSLRPVPIRRSSHLTPLRESLSSPHVTASHCACCPVSGVSGVSGVRFYLFPLHSPLRAVRVNCSLTSAPLLCALLCALRCASYGTARHCSRRRPYLVSPSPSPMPSSLPPVTVTRRCRRTRHAHAHATRSDACHSACIILSSHSLSVRRSTCTRLCCRAGAAPSLLCVVLTRAVCGRRCCSERRTRSSAALLCRLPDRPVSPPFSQPFASPSLRLRLRALSRVCEPELFRTDRNCVIRWFVCPLTPNTRRCVGPSAPLRPDFVSRLSPVCAPPAPAPDRRARWPVPRPVPPASDAPNAAPPLRSFNRAVLRGTTAGRSRPRCVFALTAAAGSAHALP